MKFIRIGNYLIRQQDIKRITKLNVNEELEEGEWVLSIVSVFQDDDELFIPYENKSIADQEFDRLQIELEAK